GYRCAAAACSAPGDFSDQAGNGGRVGRLGSVLAEISRSSAVGGDRWRLRQESVSASGGRGGGHRHQSSAQRRGLVRGTGTAQTAWAWPPTNLRQEIDQPGQACGTKARLAERHVCAVWRRGDQALQDLLGDLQASGWIDSRGAGQRREWHLAGIFLYPNQSERGGGVRGGGGPLSPGASVPRCQRSAWRGPSADAQLLVECRGLPHEAVVAHVHRTVGLAVLADGVGRPTPESVG